MKIQREGRNCGMKMEILVCENGYILETQDGQIFVFEGESTYNLCDKIRALSKSCVVMTPQLEELPGEKPEQEEVSF